MPGDEKLVVLAFDDGPAPLAALESIPQTLQQSEIKAEFYVLGAAARQYPKAARMIVRQGHDIQNHSASLRLALHLKNCWLHPVQLPDSGLRDFPMTHQ